MRARLLEGIRDRRARAVVLDVTGVPEIDTVAANQLIAAVASARMMGAEVIISGLSAEIAQTLVDRRHRPLARRLRRRPPGRDRDGRGPSAQRPLTPPPAAGVRNTRAPEASSEVMRPRTEPLARLLGDGVEVECADGSARRYVNLDNAASTCAMTEVWSAVEAFMPLYSSVHRGSGAMSQFATAAFEDARDAVREFVGGRPEDEVVLVRNTTEAINVLAEALPSGTRVLSSAAEHHANMLPWRRHDVTVMPMPGSSEELLAGCERALAAARPGIDLLAVTGASNVTGEVWPVAELAALAHRHGAQLFVDAAQLAPHRAIDMAGSGIDHLALSGHKLYAPLGAGALIGDGARLRSGAPLLRGGGAVELVTLDDVLWAGGPARHEAGSPNVVGAVALGAACRRLRAIGMDAVAARERALAERLWRGLREIPGLERSASSRRAPWTGSAWPPSTCAATAIPCSRRSSAPSTRSACATAASARIR